MRTKCLVMILSFSLFTALEITPTGLSHSVQAAVLQRRGAVVGMAVSTPIPALSPTAPSLVSVPAAPDLTYVPGTVPAGTKQPRVANPNTPGRLTPVQGGSGTPSVASENNGPRHKGFQFPAMGFATVSPGDPDLSVGLSSVVEVTNTAYAVYQKSTHAKTAGLPFSQLFSSFDGGHAFCVDPRTVYWAWDNRYLMSCVDANPSHYATFFAISLTGDPNGQWIEYDLATGFIDQPKVVVTADKIVLAGNNNTGTMFVAYQKSDMLAGIFNVRYASLQSTVGSYQAAINATNTFDAKFVGWAAGGQDISVYNVSGSPASNNVTGTATDLGRFASGSASLSDPAIPGGHFGGGNIDGRIMQAMEETETSDNKDVMVFSAMYLCAGRICPITGKIDLSGTPRYYGGNSSGNTYGETNEDVTYGSVGMDAAGNILIVSSRSNAGSTPGAALMSPGHYYAVIYGNTVGTNACNKGTCDERWGDYLGVAQDPSNRSHVWVVGSYQKANGADGWGTVIAEATATQIF